MATSSSAISSARLSAAAARSSRGWLRTAALISSSAHLRLIAVGRVAEQRRIGALERLVGGIRAQREPDAVGGGRADQRRAAHLHGLDRVRRVVQRRKSRVTKRCGSARLVDDADRLAVGLEPDRARGFAVDFHGARDSAVCGLRQSRRPCLPSQSATMSARAGGLHMAIDYEEEYNNRARVPEHPEIFARWAARGRRLSRARRARRAELGLAYGPSPRQTIDLFPATRRRRTAPLALFIHGG